MKSRLDNLFDEFVDYCTFSLRLRPATIRGYKEAFKIFIRLMPEVKLPIHLTKENINLFFKRLQTRKRIVGKNIEKIGVKDSTIKSYWTKLNSFFEWLKSEKHIEINPLEKIKCPEPKYEDRRALEKNDIEKIITAITLNSKNSLMLKRDLAIISTLVFCGIRKGELLGLKVTDVDSNREILTVRSETSKSKSTRQIPMNSTLVLHVKDYLDERNKRGYKTEYLFVSNNKDFRLSEPGLIHLVRRLKKLSGVNFHLHRFRHTFAYNLASKNICAVKIQKLMGHTDLRMTERYLRSMTPEDMRDDINKLSIDDLL